MRETPHRTFRAWFDWYTATLDEPSMTDRQIARLTAVLMAVNSSDGKVPDENGLLVKLKRKEPPKELTDEERAAEAKRKTLQMRASMGFLRPVTVPTTPTSKPR